MIARVLIALAAGAFALAFCHDARADSIARSGDNWVRVSAKACSHEAVRAQMAATGENPDDFRAATAHVGGQDFAGCWRPDFDAGKVILLYEDGDAGALPFTDFKPTPEA